VDDEVGRHADGECADLAFHAALLMRAGRTGMQANESNP